MDFQQVKTTFSLTYCWYCETILKILSPALCRRIVGSFLTFWPRAIYRDMHFGHKTAETWTTPAYYHASNRLCEPSEALLFRAVLWRSAWYWFQISFFRSSWSCFVTFRRLGSLTRTAGVASCNALNIYFLLREQ